MATKTATKTLFDDEKTIEHDPTERTKSGQPKRKPGRPKKPKNEVAVRKAEPARIATPAVPTVEPATMLQMIAAAARDPAVDVPKMRELMAMRKELAMEQAEIDYDEAMSQAQAKMEPIRADASNPQTKSKYASYKALDKALRPIYTTHGFSISFDTAPGGTDSVSVIANVKRGGVTRRHQIPMPTDGKGAKGGDVMTKTHAVGAALTYGQRYLLKMIFNIAVGRDDDGNSGPPMIDPGELIDDDSVVRLTDLCAAVGLPTEKFISRMDGTRPRGHPPIHRVADLPKVREAEAIKRLNAYEAERKEREGRKNAPTSNAERG